MKLDPSEFLFGLTRALRVHADCRSDLSGVWVDQNARDTQSRFLLPLEETSGRLVGNLTSAIGCVNASTAHIASAAVSHGAAVQASEAVSHRIENCRIALGNARNTESAAQRLQENAVSAINSAEALLTKAG